MLFSLIALIALISITFTFFFLCFMPEKKDFLSIKENNLKPIGFWKRQFLAEATVNQKVFDWFLGIILPVICFTFDPFVFSRTNAPLGPYKPFAYLLSFASIMAMMAFLLWGKKLKWLNGFLCGFFILGSAISLVVGILLFPFSVIGLIVLIGALGFTPLFSAFVYWRNAVRAFNYAQPILGKQFLIHSAILSALFGFVAPYLVNVKIHHELKTIERGDIPMIQKKTRALWMVSPILNASDIREAYFHEFDNPARKQALRQSYKALSGREPADVRYGTED